MENKNPPPAKGTGDAGEESGTSNTPLLIGSSADNPFKFFADFERLMKREPRLLRDEE